jgi:hypothetical protein
MIGSGICSNIQEFSEGGKIGEFSWIKRVQNMSLKPLQYKTNRGVTYYISQSKELNKVMIGSGICSNIQEFSEGGKIEGFSWIKGVQNMSLKPLQYKTNRGVTYYISQASDGEVLRIERIYNIR